MRKLLFSLRIAISSVGGVCCLLMIAWWVRSYSCVDGGHVKVCPWDYVQFHGGSGRMCVWFEHKPTDRWFSWHSRPNTEQISPNDKDRMPVFDLAFWPTFARLYIAHWFLAVLAGLLAAVPWCPTRFSLRTLLIATTVTAAVIGAIAWVDNTF